MITDCGFWDINGDYIEDYQELNEIEAQEVLRKPKRKESLFNHINENPN
jgi:hypothetical protein